MGGKGGGFSGTTIKDTWTKPRGGGSNGGRRVWLGWGGQWWGVNADNCN